MSNQCLQMTTALSCANRCLFCWRGHKEPVCKDWEGTIDDPKHIFDEAIKSHHQLLVGFKGSSKKNNEAYEQSKTVKHVALSLTGEPLIYPKINEIIELFDNEKISTFLVTNAQYPEEMKNLKPITQLYLSLDAPNKELLKKVDVPLFDDYWKRLLKSLEYLSKKKQRTCIRLTVIKDLNDFSHKEYADLINKGSPDFIEVKAYMHVGQSQQRLKRENMPLHEEIVKFSKELIQDLPDYEIVSEHIPSRVVMFAKKKFKIDGMWNTWIDFDRWEDSNKDIDALSYSKKTPEVGLSGKGTIDNMPEHVKERYKKEHPEYFVDEKTQEMDFYKK